MDTPPLTWKDGAPFSTQYQDVYFSSLDGAQESQQVFLAGNQLASRFAKADQRHFTIVELGFGTGLNFLMTWQLWQQSRHSDSWLHFVSLEKYPLSVHDLARCLLPWSALQKQAALLLASYTNIQPGINTLCFEQQRLRLSLVIGDANQQLPQLVLRADAWFLDGFAPARNPEMWTQTIFEAMAKHSHAASSFATFSSASAVRRGLEQVGFVVHKVSGYGKKREMLRGHFSAKTYTPSQVPRNAIVIGGGIAGASSARALADLGIRVTLLEAQAEVVRGASGHHQAVLYPRFTKDYGTPLEALNRCGFLYSWRLFSRHTSYYPCGVIELEGQGARRSLATQDWLSAQNVSEIAGVAMARRGHYFAKAGFVQPLSLCNELLSHPNIDVHCNTPARQLQAHSQGWQVKTPSQQHQAALVVVATAHNVQELLPDSYLPMQVVRGQTSLLTSTPESKKLRCILCDSGYITPAWHDQHSLGATFDRDDMSLVLRACDHQRNFAGLATLSLLLHQELRKQTPSGYVGLRAQTPDYLPLCGLLLNHLVLRERPPRYNATLDSLPWLQGLYVNVGHGAKGFLSAPLCASIIAAQVTDTPMPAHLDLLGAMQVNRFILRALGCKALAKRLLR